MTEHEIISAFVDHEPVDPRQLSDALSDESGRQYLVELLSLQALVDETDATRVQPLPDRVTSGPWKRSGHWRTWAMAAAATIVLGAGAFFVGMQTGQQGAPVNAVAAQRAPEPQRVIELREGIEWHQTVQGN